MIVGVPNAAPASAARSAGLAAMSVMTTNCKPISAPAAEPTMTQKLSHLASSDMTTLRRRSAAVLLVADLLHPIDDLAVDRGLIVAAPSCALEICGARFRLEAVGRAFPDDAG